MKKIITYPLSALLFPLLVGCLANEGAHNGEIGDPDNANDDYPIAYNTKQEEAERQGINLNNETPRNRQQYLEGFETELEKPNNQNSNYTQSFYNQDSQMIAKEVNELEEVDLSQAIVTDERIIVSAMLNQKEYDVEIEEIVNKIRDRAAQTVPNKEVVVYTDAIYWNKMRDLNARLKNADGRDASVEHIDNFLENNNK